MAERRIFTFIFCTVVIVKAVAVGVLKRQQPVAPSRLSLTTSSHSFPRLLPVLLVPVTRLVRPPTLTPFSKQISQPCAATALGGNVKRSPTTRYSPYFPPAVRIYPALVSAVRLHRHKRIHRQWMRHAIQVCSARRRDLLDSNLPLPFPFSLGTCGSTSSCSRTSLSTSWIFLQQSPC